MSTTTRFFPLVGREAATGRTAKIYRHAEKELGTVGLPLQSLSAAPELLVPFWALLREALLVGAFDERIAKEAVALTVSQGNRCDYCTNAHGFLLYAADAPDLAGQLLSGEQPNDSDLAAVVEWAQRTAGHGDNPASNRGPFDDDAEPRFIGTALTFHFINRMVTALTSDTFPVPASAGAKKPDPWTNLLRQEISSGAGVALMGEPRGWAKDGKYGVPHWARESPVGLAWGRLKGTAELGGQLLGADTAQAVSEAIQVYIDNPPSCPDWIDHRVTSIDGVPEAVRVALLAGVEPALIAANDINKLRENSELSNHCITFLIAFGAISAASHIEQNMAGSSHSEDFNVQSLQHRLLLVGAGCAGPDFPRRVRHLQFRISHCRVRNAPGPRLYDHRRGIPRHGPSLHWPTAPKTCQSVVSHCRPADWADVAGDDEPKCYERFAHCDWYSRAQRARDRGHNRTLHPSSAQPPPN